MTWKSWALFVAGYVVLTGLLLFGAHYSPSGIIVGFMLTDALRNVRQLRSG